MQVAERRENYRREKFSLTKKAQELLAAQAQHGAMPYELTEVHGVYEATGSGVHVCGPVLSEEARQPTPFVSLSWEHWQEVRAQVLYSLEHFVLAAEGHQTDEVVNACMEMQVAVYRMFLEAHVMSAGLELQALPQSDV